MKKLLALILCLTLAVSVFAGCGGGGGLEAAGEGNEGPVATMDQQEIPEDLTLTIGIPLSASVEDYDTNAYTLWLEEQTGYDLEFITFQSSSTDYKAQLSTMLATGDELPDILWTMTAIDEALRCKKEGKRETILFGLTGTGYFDMYAYQKHNDGVMSDYIPTEEELEQSFARLPKID